MYAPDPNCTLLDDGGNQTLPLHCNDTMGPPSLFIIIMTNMNIVIYAIIFVLGIIGNSLVIYVVYRFAKMKTVTNMYIMNLAMADQLFLLSIPLLIHTSLIGKWSFGTPLCKIYMVFSSVNMYTSSLFLLVMSSDRYLAVCQPVRSVKWRTPLHAKLVCGFVWTMSILVMIPIALYARTTDEYHCGVLWPSSQLVRAESAFIWYSFLLGFGIPVSLTLIFYVMVLSKLKRLGPKSESRSKAKKKSHRKVTKMVMTVITVYICCWFPYWVMQIVITLGNPVDTNVQLVIIVLIYSLAYANSGMNPILYAFLSDNFKKSFIKAFKCAATSDGLNNETSVFPTRGSRNKGNSKRRRGVDSDEEDDIESTHVTSLHGKSRESVNDNSATPLADMKNGRNHSIGTPNSDATPL
ncbi:PREDICTED: somatostatin receptor type 2-like [Priapulus caudatus]|uniref:Somatostatin receptor type 2-like n=1 Tax=Priapulus caudatus TaxID=37621 RepID=A0ABM1EZ76_PRICU|nr:PREDICTED: somatostatin receptor type 2-like [Priapulus caudatus]